MEILKKSCTVFIPLLLTACIEDFTPKIDVEPVLCMNALITAGEPINVSVTHTWLYTDENSEADHSVNDAVLTLIVNGEETSLDYIPVEGDRIRLLAESLTYGRAEAEVIVPYAPQIKSFVYDTQLISSFVEDRVAQMRFNIASVMEIQDRRQSDDYYQLTFNSAQNGDDPIKPSDTWPWYTGPSNGLIIGSFQYDAEPIFSEHIGVFESIMGGDSFGFTFFTDRRFRGDVYPLNLQFKDCTFYMESESWADDMVDCDIIFTLHAVSKSYYDWANYVWQHNDGPLDELGQIGFAEPLSAYSNVSTNAGVVAAQTTAVITLPLRDFIESVIHPDAVTE